MAARRFVNIGPRFKNAIDASPFTKVQLSKYVGKADSYVSSKIARGYMQEDVFISICNLIGAKPETLIEQEPIAKTTVKSAPIPAQIQVPVIPESYLNDSLQQFQTLAQQQEELLKKLTTATERIRLLTEEVKNTRDEVHGQAIEIHRQAVDRKQWQDKVYNLLKYGGQNVKA